MTSPWRRVFVMVTGFLLAFLGASLVGVYWWNNAAPDPWLREMEALPRPDGRDAMQPVLEAIARLDLEALEARRESLRKAAVGGWTIESEPLAPVLDAHDFLVSAAQRSAAMPDARFPLLGDRGNLTVRPRFERLELVILLLGANARRLEHAGRHEEALQRFVELAALGNRFARSASEATLTHHLVALSALEISTNGIISILERGSASGEVPARLEAQLAALESGRAPVSEGIRTEMAIHHKDLADAGGDPERLRQVLLFYDPELKPAEAAHEARDLVADALSFPQESGRVYGELQAAMALPAWERPALDQAWLEERTQNRWLVRQFLAPAPLLARESAAIARLRLARALALRAAGRADEAAAIIDPFTGQPLRATEESLYSVGPDGSDDGGTIAWQPAAGVASGGDIVVRLRPR